MMGASIQSVTLSTLIFTVMASALVEKDVNEGSLLQIGSNE